MVVAASGLCQSVRIVQSFPSRYPHPPHGRGTLILLMEDLCLGLLLAPLRHPGSLLFPLYVLAQTSSFSVGTATAAPGQKSTGHLEVHAGVDAVTNTPVIVINVEKRGPVLALVSGAHGTEYTVIAIEKLINLLDPSQIVGTVILVPASLAAAGGSFHLLSFEITAADTAIETNTQSLVHLRNSLKTKSWSFL